MHRLWPALHPASCSPTTAPKRRARHAPPPEDLERRRRARRRRTRPSGSRAGLTRRSALRPGALSGARGGTPAAASLEQQDPLPAPPISVNPGAARTPARSSHGGERSGTQTHRHTWGLARSRACFSTDGWHPSAALPSKHQSSFVRLLQATISLAWENHLVWGGHGLSEGPAFWPLPPRTGTHSSESSPLSGGRLAELQG